jgi:glycine cleavage system H protein
MDNYPEDLKYHKEHMWVRSDGTIGITFYAQDQLGEIVFIEVPEAGADIEAGEAFGEVESRKSVSASEMDNLLSAAEYKELVSGEEAP